MAMLYFANTLWVLGDIEGAAPLIGGAETRIAALKHVGSRAYGKMLAAQLAFERSEVAQTASSASELVRLARDHDLNFWHPYGLILEGWTKTESGAPGGLEDVRRGAQLLQEQSVLAFDGTLGLALAQAEARAGDQQRAVAVLDEALASSNRTGGRGFDAELHRLRGEILLKCDPGSVALAEEALQTASAVAKQQGARSFELRAALSLAKLYQSTARPVDAHGVLAPALKGFSPTPEMPEIAEAQMLLAGLAATDEVKAQAAQRQRLTQLHAAYGNALIATRGHGAPETMEAFARARKSASGDEDAPGRFAADYGLWVGSYVRGDLPSMRTHAAAFLAGVAARPDSPEAGVAHRVLGTTHCFAGEYAEAREQLERALTLFQPGRDDDLAFRFGQDAGVAAMCYLAIASWPLGNVRRAVSLVDGAHERLAKVAHIGTRPYAKLHAAMFELLRGDRCARAENGSETARLAREHDLPLWRAYGAFFEALATAERGALGEGLSDMRRCAESLRQQDLLNFDGLFKIALAEAEARAGDRDRAIAILDEALATADRLGYRAFEAELNRTRGEILVESRPRQSRAGGRGSSDRHRHRETASHTQLRTTRRVFAGEAPPIDWPSRRRPRCPRARARRLFADAGNAGDRRGAGVAIAIGVRPLRSVKAISRSNAGYGPDCGPSPGDPCKRASRPNATSTVAIRNVRFTSIRDTLIARIERSFRAANARTQCNFEWRL